MADTTSLVSRAALLTAYNSELGQGSIPSDGALPDYIQIGTTMKSEEKNKIIEDTRAKYGLVYEASPNAHPDVFVLYIKPTRNVYRQYRIDQGDPAYEFSAQERLWGLSNS